MFLVTAHRPRQPWAIGKRQVKITEIGIARVEVGDDRPLLSTSSDADEIGGIHRAAEPLAECLLRVRAHRAGEGNAVCGIVVHVFHAERGRYQR